MSEARATRKLAAIINGDVVGYSRLMANDEDATIAALGELRSIVGTLISTHNGELVDFTGDNFLAQFPSTIDSIECALEIQRAIAARNENSSQQNRMQCRIGAHVGDIRTESGRIYGSGVNIAARLEALAEPGGVCLSQQLLDLITDKLDLAVEDCGPQNVKNIPKPVHAYRIAPTGSPAHDDNIREHAAIRTHLLQILGSAIFSKSPRQQRFLKHIVDNALSGNLANLKGYAIGLEVFDRTPDFDPAVDSIVRVEATRLRAKLREYYGTLDNSAPITIELPKGSYVPKFNTSTARTASGQETTPRGQRLESGVAGENPSIIVLPFTNLSNDKDQEYFVDGVTEDLIMGLSKLSNLHVVARHSSFYYKDKKVRIAEIARDIDVRYVVEGSVRKSAGKIRVAAELVLADSEEPIWRERYDRNLDDIFAVQDDVVHNIVTALDIKLNARDRARLETERTVDLEAYDLVSRGRECFWRYTPKDVQDSAALFSSALKIDPNYALAHGWLARAIVLPIAFNWSKDRDSLDIAIEHARRALQIEPNLPYAHGITSWTHLWRRELHDALVEGQLAIDLDPNDFESHMFFSLVLSSAGKGHEAIAHARRCISLNPHTPATAVFALGLAHLVAGELEIAQEVLESGRRRFPTYLPFYIFLAQLYVETNSREAAVSMIAMIDQQSGESMRDVNAWNILVEAEAHDRYVKGRDLAIKWYDESRTAQ